MLQEFIDKWNGKPLEFNQDAYKNQCVDLIQAWESSIGSPITRGNAKDQFKDWDGYVKVPNTTTGVPKAGDIVIWGTVIGQWGHIAIFVEGDTNRFRSFDQNWPTGSVCKIVDHSYNGVLGWLHPQVLDAPDPKDTEISKLRAINSDLTGLADSLRADLTIARKDLDNWKNSYNTDVANLKKQIEELKKRPAEVKTVYVDKPIQVIKEVIKEVPVERVVEKPVIVEKEVVRTPTWGELIILIWNKIKNRRIDGNL